MEISDWVKQLGYYDEDEEDTVRLLVFGEMGVGKTKLAGTFPQGFFIDTDKGGATIRHKHLPRIKLSRGDKVYRIILDILKRIKEKTEPFDKIEVRTLVLDSITSLADMMMMEIMLYPQPGKLRRDPILTKPEWDDYIVLANELKEIVARSQDLGLHVVATCGEKLERDEEKGTFVGKPNIQGGFRDVIGHAFDEVYHMVVEGSGDNAKYISYTKKHGYFMAKSRFSEFGVPAKFENADFPKIQRALLEAKKRYQEVKKT